MMDKELTIRCNLVDSIERHVEAEKRKAAEEQARRDKEWADRREENARKEAEFKRLHPNIACHTYVTHSSFDTYKPYYSGPCNVYFYEWSNLEGEPRHFKYYGELYMFLDECRLFMRDEQVSTMRKMKECHIICMPWGKELALGEDHLEMCREYKLCCNKHAMAQMA